MGDGYRGVGVSTEGVSALGGLGIKPCAKRLLKRMVKYTAQKRLWRPETQEEAAISSQQALSFFRKSWGCRKPLGSSTTCESWS